MLLLAPPCSLHSHRRQKRGAAWRADRAGSASCRLRSGRQRARRPGPPSLRRPRHRGGPRLHSHSSSPRLGRPLPVLAPQLVWPSGTRPLPSPLPAHGRSEANAHGWPDFAAPRPRSVRRGRSRPWSVRRHRSRLPAACPAPRFLARGRPGGDRRSQSAAVTASLLSAHRRRPRPPLRALLGLLQQQLRSEARGWSTPCGSSTDSTTTPNADSSAPTRAPVQLLFYRPRDLSEIKPQLYGYKFYSSPPLRLPARSSSQQEAEEKTKLLGSAETQVGQIAHFVASK
ncbi:uncharacterized protein LOC120681877 [Panicum virgatum]|uniref:Uncharacterized protein n=1 Tax=Panicum virgatum TaxID=38727 RepID=A0A8T0Q8S8_PANVG|nr:uncharacterized protein LOC120681877 [Panicum virgatum]KAG2566734.1 hypothetical protein PVAP13_7NG247400 [Panicum virgatum]